MCDCYDLACKCGKFYVPIHIADFKYPRNIIKQVYCPYCNYRGPKISEVMKSVKKKKKDFYVIETNRDGEFAIANWIFHSGIPRGDEGIKEEIHSIGGKAEKGIRGYFAIEYNKKHKDYVSAQKFLDEHVDFNGNPNDVENMVPDCYHYHCKNLIKKEKPTRGKSLLKLWGKTHKVDYCKKYRKEIFAIKRNLKYDCKYLQKTAT